MIEDELRLLMADLVEPAPDNPRRTMEVRARARALRRRFTAATAVGLVLVTGVGAALVRLSGVPAPTRAATSSPTHLPAGPYFPDSTTARVVGFSNEGNFNLNAPKDVMLPVGHLAYTHAIVVRCPQRGRLTVTNLGTVGTSVAIPCDQQVGDHAEGALVLTPDLMTRLSAPVPALDLNVRITPGGPGTWTVAYLLARATEPLPEWTGAAAPLLEGSRDRTGGSFTTVIPAAEGEVGLTLVVNCVDGVRLDFSIAGRGLGAADCDSRFASDSPSISPDGASTFMRAGNVRVRVPSETLQRLDLRPGSNVTVTVRSFGRQTDEWRVVPLR